MSTDTKFEMRLLITLYQTIQAAKGIDKKIVGEKDHLNIMEHRQDRVLLTTIIDKLKKRIVSKRRPIR
jgi:hypothetical protein